jgi:hypothetical protein
LPQDLDSPKGTTEIAKNLHNAGNSSIGDIGEPGSVKNEYSVKDISKIKQSSCSLVGLQESTFNEQSNNRKFSLLGPLESE